MTAIDRNKIQEPFMKRPHVVILGAGASYAALPNGDKNGRRLPLMNNIVDIVGLEPLLSAAGVTYASENFETIYSDLVGNGSHQAIVEKIESAIFDYFSAMELPDSPTLYDHLVLSLRKKDVIATFNWDPFLLQAIARNAKYAPMPQVLFLHGNVAVGHCIGHHTPATLGLRGNTCGTCGRALQSSRLLYPVAQKNYSNDPSIHLSWKTLHEYLESAFVLTLFGYGAPASDTEAVSLMKQAWGDVNSRQYEETEVIDIKDEDALTKTWQPFIHTHHYQTQPSFYDSIIALHPRRSCDAMWRQIMDGEFIDNNPVPHTADWPELRKWFQPIVDDEVDK